jgi:hypothetical protein
MTSKQTPLGIRSVLHSYLLPLMANKIKIICATIKNKYESSVEWFPVSHQKCVSSNVPINLQRKLAKTITLLTCGFHSSEMLRSTAY